MAALRWVYATLVESAIMAYEFVLPPLTLSDRGQYYAESKRMAALFGISAEALPKDWTGFLQYTAKMFDSPQLRVDAGALALGRSVMSGAGTWIRPPHWYGALTAYWMPPRLRAAFALPFGAREEEAVRSAGAVATPSLSFYSRRVALRRPLSRGQRPAAWSRPGTPHPQEQLVLDGPAATALRKVLGLISGSMEVTGRPL